MPRLNEKDLRSLAKAVTSAQPGVATNFAFEGAEAVTLSYDALNETLREEIQSLASSSIEFERNKHIIFSLIQESVDAKLPRELGKHLEGFVEVKQYGEADKPQFTIKRPNKQLRGRSFVTLGAPGGVYEVFRIAKERKVDINITAMVAAVQIDFEDFITGRIDWNELLDIITLGMEDRLYDEVLKNFKRIEQSLPTANKASTQAFDAEELNNLLGVVEVYGAPTILCTARFARAITEGTDWASEKEKVARREVGYLTDYKNAKIIVLPNSFKDESNSEKVLDDSIAWILPANREPIFKIALQGKTQVRNVDNEDWSIELQTYKKAGVASFVFNDIARYEIKGLK